MQKAVRVMNQASAASGNRVVTWTPAPKFQSDLPSATVRYRLFLVADGEMRMRERRNEDSCVV